jgi:dTDP-glucose 4,6-dehydratase/UDP-glucuronate decarboxylase
LKSAKDVVDADLQYICGGLKEEMQHLAGKRLLITGGAGFLGFYLVQAALHWNKLEGKGQPICLTVCDSYVRGVPEWLTRLGRDKNLELVQHDVTQPLPPELDDFQYVVHAASIASPIFYRLHPIETMDANVTGLRRLLDHLRRQMDANKPFDGFLFYSSSEIYGDPPPESIPTPETYNGNVSCTGPRACYDESKRYGETLCVNFARQRGMPVRVARPFNNYGPGLKITDRRVVPDFARDIMAERNIVLLSDGSPMRTFCYVADAIIGYFKILTNGNVGEAYNIGVEQPEITIAELAERVTALAHDLFGYRGKVEQRTSPDNDYLADNPRRRCPSISKARQQLGYDPGITLDDGLRRSLLWYAENREPEHSR